MTGLNILVTLPVDEGYIGILKAACPDGSFVFNEAPTEAEILSADVIIGVVPKEILPGCTHLKLLQLSMAGADSFVGYVPQGAKLACSSGAFGLAIAEHMLASLLCVMKKLHLYRDNQNKALWQDEGNVTSICGAAVLTVGVGDIGGEFAKRCKALGAYNIGVRRTVREKPDYIDEMHTLAELDALLPRADVVALALPSGRETNGLMDERRIALMKQNATLLNVGRGSAVDGYALARAAREGRVRAALDVTDPEPLPADHPLWSAPNVLITPHVSGFFHLRHTHTRIVEICSENLRRFCADEPLLNIVDSHTGYRREENRA